MKYKVPFILFMFLAIQASSWGMIGHRVVGQIAEQYLSKKASKEVKKILGTESLTDVANWMDFIKSEPKYNFMGPWHYCMQFLTVSRRTDIAVRFTCWSASMSTLKLPASGQ